MVIKKKKKKAESSAFGATKYVKIKPESHTTLVISDRLLLMERF